MSAKDSWQFHVFTDAANNILSSDCDDGLFMKMVQPVLHKYGAEIEDNTSLLLVNVLPLNYRVYKTSENTDGIAHYKYVFIQYHATPSDDLAPLDQTQG